MADIIRALIINISMVLLILGIVIGWIKADSEADRANSIFKWVMLLGAGFVAIYAFIFHVFFPDIASSTIGWKSNSFEYEVGIANLAAGVLCIVAFSKGRQFQAAALLGITIWLWGDAVGHIRDMITMHNFSVGNAGSWFWSDVLTPLTLILTNRNRD